VTTLNLYEADGHLHPNTITDLINIVENKETSPRCNPNLAKIMKMNNILYFPLCLDTIYSIFVSDTDMSYVDQIHEQLKVEKNILNISFIPHQSIIDNFGNSDFIKALSEKIALIEADNSLQAENAMSIINKKIDSDNFDNLSEDEIKAIGDRIPIIMRYYKEILFFEILKTLDGEDIKEGLISVIEGISLKTLDHQNYESMGVNECFQIFFDILETNMMMKIKSLGVETPKDYLPYSAGDQTRPSLFKRNIMYIGEAPNPSA